MIKVLVKTIPILMLICFSTCHSDMKESQQTFNYTSLRKKMVEEQIQVRGISDQRVLKSMLKVPRHEFVPEKYRFAAYEDSPLIIGEDQTISQPYIVALMTELLDLKTTDKVFEVGTGSGYQAAIIAEIVSAVYTIEIIESLANKATGTLEKLGYTNVYTRWGDGYQGWKEHAPYDAIIVTAAPDHIPEPLVEQLANGGKMVIPVGENYQELYLLKKGENGKITKRSVIPVRFVPMTGEVEKY